MPIVFIVIGVIGIVVGILIEKELKDQEEINKGKNNDDSNVA